MTKIGVISDTHGVLLPTVYNALADCDAIIHAGDIGDPGILRELETLAPVYAVLGNNDYNEYGFVSKYSRPCIDGVQFLVGHRPADVKVGVFGSSALAPGDPIPAVCIHGHTHVPQLVYGADARPAQFILCPGSVTKPRLRSVKTLAFISVSNGRIEEIAIQNLDGETLDSWHA